MLLSSLLLLLSSQSVFAFASPPQAPRPPAMVAAAATGAGALAPAAELHGALVAYDGDAQLKARIESALRVLDAVGSTNVGLQLDLYHLQVPRRDSRTTVRCCHSTCCL